MFCFKCGKEIPAGAAFCPNCGAKAPAGLASPSAGGPAAPADQAAQTDQPAPPAETPAQPAPPAGAVVPDAASAPAQPGARTAGDPLAAIVGKHADYYLAEFKRIDAGQKPWFNWAAFLFGPMMCFYRRSWELFKKYFLPIYIALYVTTLLVIMSIMMSLASVTGPIAVVGVILMLVAAIGSFATCIWGLVNAIRLGRNFNRDYYVHCKQQLARPMPERKGGTSIKNVVLFLLAQTGIDIVLSIAGGLLVTLVLSATLNSVLGDDSYYNEDTYVESSSYYGEADSYTERPASSERQTASSTSEAITEYNLPVGTYQLWIGYGGTTASIRLWNEPSDLETPWYCDVILWNGIDAIVDEYYGSAYVSDDLQTIICGDYTFGIGYDGSVLVDDSLSDVPYDVIYYSGDTSMETGLNALIDISDEFTPVTKEAVDAYSDLYSLDRTIIHMSMH